MAINAVLFYLDVCCCIQATAVRESVLPVAEREEDVLLNICKSGDRSKTAKAVPGIGEIVHMKLLCIECV